MELTFEQKLAAILHVGTLGTINGKFCFTPDEDKHDTFDLKKGWSRTNRDLHALVNSVFSNLISTSILN